MWRSLGCLAGISEMPCCCRRGRTLWEIRWISTRLQTNTDDTRARSLAPPPPSLSANRRRSRRWRHAGSWWRHQSPWLQSKHHSHSVCLLIYLSIRFVSRHWQAHAPNKAVDQCKTHGFGSTAKFMAVSCNGINLLLTATTLRRDFLQIQAALVETDPCVVNWTVHQ